MKRLLFIIFTAFMAAGGLFAFEWTLGGEINTLSGYQGNGLFTFEDKEILVITKEGSPVFMGIAANWFIIGPLKEKGLLNRVKQSWLSRSFTLKVNEKTDFSLEKEVKEKYDQGICIKNETLMAYLYTLSNGKMLTGGTFSHSLPDGGLAFDLLVNSAPAIRGGIFQTAVTAALKGRIDGIILGGISYGDRINPGYTLKAAGEYKTKDMIVTGKIGFTTPYFLDIQGDSADNPYFWGLKSDVFLNTPYELTFSYQQRALSFEEKLVYHKGLGRIKGKAGFISYTGEYYFIYDDTKDIKLKHTTLAGITVKGPLFTFSAGTSFFWNKDGIEKLYIDGNGICKIDNLEITGKNRLHYKNEEISYSGKVKIKISGEHFNKYTLWAIFEYKSDSGAVKGTLGITLKGESSENID